MPLTATVLESTGDGQDERQHTTTFVQLNRISTSAQLANNHGIVFVHNPYYMFTDPTYCLTTMHAIDRECLEFHRQAPFTRCYCELGLVTTIASLRDGYHSAMYGANEYNNQM